MKTHIFLLPFYLILFGVDTILVSSQCQINHQTILIRLKNELQFDSSLSTKLVTWNPNATDCCSWGGVTCSIKGQVIGLDLSNETISGGITDSSALFGLKNLESLNLAANEFSSIPISSRFGSLASLSYLNLSNSGFSGQIPEELSQLTRLEVLDLSSFFSDEFHSLKLENPGLATLVRNLTGLKGLCMDRVNMSSHKLDWCQGLSSSLPNLEVLSLSDCQLSGPLDESLQKLQSLSVIRLAWNDLSAPVPDFFANFKNLTILDLFDCNLIGTFPKKVMQLESLQILDLSFNSNLCGSLPDFPMNGSLQTLALSFTNFSGKIPESIGNLKNLSIIDLGWSNFSGGIPKSMENLTQLSSLDLSSNKFIGEIPSFKLCKNLTYIDLSRNGLSGGIPKSMKKLNQLSFVDLSSNKFIGKIPSFRLCKNLTHIDLSSNGLSGMIPFDHFQDLNNLFSVDLGFNSFNGSIPSSLFSLPNVQGIDLSNNNFDGLLPQFSNSSIPLLKRLDLSSNKLKGEIPRSFFELGQLEFLFLSSNNLSGEIETKDFQGLNNLMYLDLSDNKIQGEIPNFDGLSYLNLSHNNLTSLQEPYTFQYINVLDLHSNRLSGAIPIPPQKARIIDYSDNLFNSSISESIGRNLTFAYFFSVSNNLLTGTIPDTLCNATNLEVLDLSNNRLNGTIPQCLIELSGKLEHDRIYDRDIGKGLGVLNLGNNSLSGQIEGAFLSNCSLNTLDLHGNSLEGKIPQSLVNCRMLQVLNLGNNKINDTYPCSLGNNTNLHVLVLRSNRFHGSVHCGEGRHNWSNLHILDIAHNNFNGVVPPEFFSQWGAMMTVENITSTKQLSFAVIAPVTDVYYQDTVTVTVKGFELELVKILTVFTTIDISSNRFSGVIPETIGQLKALYLFNMSHNEFTGSIPQSMGNLSQLESLDMSRNKLTGNIPSSFASLNFLSTLNLSYNQLEGRIPVSTQLQSFEKYSYIGNKGLCGPPLNQIGISSVLPVPSPLPNSDTSGDGNDWLTIFYGMGAGAGSLTVAAVLYTLYKASTSSTTRQTRSV